MYICHARKWIDFWYWISDTFRLVQMFPHLATSWIAKSALLEPTLLKTNSLPLKNGGWETILSFFVSAHFTGSTSVFREGDSFDGAIILLSWGQFAQAQFNFWVWELVRRNWFISVSYPYPIHLCLGSCTYIYIYSYTYTYIYSVTSTCNLFGIYRRHFLVLSSQPSNLKIFINKPTATWPLEIAFSGSWNRSRCFECSSVRHPSVTIPVSANASGRQRRVAWRQSFLCVKMSPEKRRRESGYNLRKNESGLHCPLK